MPCGRASRVSVRVRCGVEGTEGDMGEIGECGGGVEAPLRRKRGEGGELLLGEVEGLEWWSSDELAGS